MNLLKSGAVATVALGGLTNQDILFIISILLMVLGMLQDYLRDRTIASKIVN